MENNLDPKFNVIKRVMLFPFILLTSIYLSNIDYYIVYNNKFYITI